MRSALLIYPIWSYLRAFEFWNFSNFEHENEPWSHIITGTLFQLLFSPLVDVCCLLVAVSDWARDGKWRLP